MHKLEDNPRTIDKDSFDSLCQSIKDNPDYFEARPLILSNRTGKLVILGGNQRYEAAKKLGLKKVPTHLIEGLTEEREEEITIRDNVNNGDWDWDKLANRYDYEKLDEWGVEVPELEEKEDDTKIEEVPTPEIEEAAERKSTTVWDSPEILKTLSKKQLLEEIEKWKDDSTVWDLKRDPRSEYIHPTQKPVAIPARAIKKHSKEGDTILDLFAGSGSTLLACEQLGRKCRTMELDPRFVDRIRKRYHYFQTGSIDGWEEATPTIN